ncbi:3-methyl-2-oxobutanoate hydroxymethyltransferase [Sinorhizobium fredii]
MAETVDFLVSRGIPVLGHVGLMPQLVNTTGGYRSVGRNEKEVAKIRRDAKAIDDAGAFAIVVEGTVEPVAREITATLRCPTIGIGASPACDGQILVSDDMLGIFNDFKPRFVKHFAELAPAISKAVEDYANEVRARTFPGIEHTFQVKR